jgi:hypothetical protein
MQQARLGRLNCICGVFAKAAWRAEHVAVLPLRSQARGSDGQEPASRYDSDQHVGQSFRAMAPTLPNVSWTREN